MSSRATSGRAPRLLPRQVANVSVAPPQGSGHDARQAHFGPLRVMVEAEGEQLTIISPFRVKCAHVVALCTGSLRLFGSSVGFVTGWRQVRRREIQYFIPPRLPGGPRTQGRANCFPQYQSRDTTKRCPGVLNTGNEEHRTSSNTKCRGRRVRYAIVNTARKREKSRSTGRRRCPTFRDAERRRAASFKAR